MSSVAIGSGSAQSLAVNTEQRCSPTKFSAPCTSTRCFITLPLASERECNAAGSVPGEAHIVEVGRYPGGAGLEAGFVEIGALVGHGRAGHVGAGGDAGTCDGESADA